MQRARDQTARRILRPLARHFLEEMREKAMMQRINLALGDRPPSGMVSVFLALLEGT